MRQEPPIGRVRTPRPVTPDKPAMPKEPAPAPPEEFPVEALLMSFDSWVSNATQKFRVDAARLRRLIHEETKPGMAD